MTYANKQAVLEALAKGAIPTASAIRLLDVIAKREALQAERDEADRIARIRRVERAEAGRLAIAARALASSAVRPRPTTPIVADRQVVSAFRLNEVSKAQTSAMNCYVIELA